MGKKSYKNERNIRRVDTGATHGWQFYTSRGGELHTKLFSDSTHGSSRKALKEARDYREFYLNLVPRLPLRSNNQFGISGMSYYCNEHEEIVGVQCTVRINGKPKTKKFRQLDNESFDSVIERGRIWKESIT